jgi:hypothetical protein
MGVYGRHYFGVRRPVVNATGGFGGISLSFPYSSRHLVVIFSVTTPQLRGGSMTMTPAAQFTKTTIIS